MASGITGPRQRWRRPRLVAVVVLAMMCIGLPTLRAQSTAPEPPSEKVPVIVLDPGHGGTDTGSHGPRGLLEKDITLRVATEAARLIEQLLGLHAVLTRQDDSEVPLDARAALANQADGSLFISIHVGASFGPTPREFQALYFDDLRGAPLTAGDDSAARLRSGHRGQAGARGGPAVQAVLWDQAQFPFLESSRVFARLLYRDLRTQVGEEGHGIFGLPLLLLRWVRMPAVMLDLGSLSNPAFEAKLRDESYLQRTALGIAQAVDDYNALQR